MNRYLLLNAVLLVIALLASKTFISSLRQLRAIAVTSVVSVCVGYPWDFVAIGLGAWAHYEPGPRLYGVPLNDLILIFLMTWISASVLSSSLQPADSE